ncbi:MAG: hypothetical protein EBS84_21410 [Proteobacteria bacterium]|nr:hypothetical protein [Pseudomonadota bacterium]
MHQQIDRAHRFLEVVTGILIGRESEVFSANELSVIIRVATFAIDASAWAFRRSRFRLITSLRFRAI